MSEEGQNTERKADLESASTTSGTLDSQVRLDSPTQINQPIQDEKQFLVEWDGGNDPLSPYSMPTLRKWVLVFIVSMGSLAVTCTSSIYASAYTQLAPEFNSSREVIVLGLSLFVIGLAVGPMVVSPLSEFYGRRQIYLISSFFFLIWNIQCALAKNIETMLVGRLLDGLSGSAFLSVAAGTVSDLFRPAEIQAPMVLYTLSPFIGPILGPVMGGFINAFTTWRWTFYVLLIWSGALFVCLLFVPETYHPVLLAKKAAARRKETGNPAYYSAFEREKASKSLSRALLISLYRPFQLLFLELMCMSLCLYSALLLGILYLFFGAFPLVFTVNHGFNSWQTGLTFIGLVIGIFIAAASTPFWQKNYARLVANAKQNSSQENANQKPEPELRLPPAITGAVLIPASLFWFGWTTYSSVHWVVPIIGSIFFGAGLFLVFSAVLTFLVAAYPTYAASAVAANTCARCIFAAAFPLFGDQMYEKLGFQWASSLLGFLALAMMPFPYLFYRYGKVLREKSKFALS